MACRLFSAKSLMWTNAVLLLFECMEAYFSEICLSIQQFPKNKINLMKIPDDNHFVSDLKF